MTGENNAGDPDGGLGRCDTVIDNTKLGTLRSICGDRSGDP